MRIPDRIRRNMNDAFADSIDAAFKMQIAQAEDQT